MSTFNREWITIGPHRVLVYHRDGSPGKFVRRVARLVAWSLEYGMEDYEGRSRLVEVFYNNRHTSHVFLTIGSDDPSDLPSDGKILEACHLVFEGRGFTSSVVVVPPGPQWSDSYDHTQYIVTEVMKSCQKEAYLA